MRTHNARYTTIFTFSDCDLTDGLIAVIVIHATVSCDELVRFVRLKIQERITVIMLQAEPSISDLTDKELVQHFCETEQKSYYEVFYSRYAEKSFRKALSYVHSIDDAEDVVQNVWVKVFFKLDTFRQDSSFSTWLYRITVNESISHLRKRKTYSLDELTEDEAVQIEDVFADFLSVLEQKSDSAQALQLVAPEVRSLLLLKFAEGYTYEEIAAMTGLSQSAIKMKILRARKKIIAELKPPTSVDPNQTSL